MNIYVLRHGETDYNIEGKFQGQADIKMNKNGENQTNKVAVELKKINFDVIFSSPLSRAINTAKKISNKNIQIDKRIIERCFGKLEGQYSVSDYEENSEKYNVESIENLTLRVKSFLTDILEKYKYATNILIVTHEGIAQIINQYLSSEEKELKAFRLKPGNYVKYEFYK